MLNFNLQQLIISDDLIEEEMDSPTKGVGAIDGIDSDHAKKVPKIAAELVTCDLCGKLSRGELFHIKVSSHQ